MQYYRKLVFAFSFEGIDAAKLIMVRTLIKDD